MTGSIDSVQEPGSGTFGGHPTAEEWLSSLKRRGELGALLTPPFEEQLRRGYGHTLREICQQPSTWLDTRARMAQAAAVVEDTLRGATAIVFTGSGSSLYAGECVAPCLQGLIGVPVSTVPTGTILTHPEAALPPTSPVLVVSLARSGDSPESRAAIDWLLENRPDDRNLVITCNRAGALAAACREPAVRVIVLDERTNDRSLVMTSSFTNLVLAARLLGSAAEGQECERRVRACVRAAAGLLQAHSDRLAVVARSGFDSVVYLGSGCCLGAAREAALKMLEMNGGEAWTLAESYLGLRHGPMSAIRPGTLVVGFLASDPLVRAYELDVLAEIERKGLGAGRVLVGAEIPKGVAEAPRTLAVDLGPDGSGSDGELVLLDVVVGQLLAFFRCLCSGYRPDAPSETSVITRVVSSFAIHRRDDDGEQP